jgi:hypothetical protein
LGLPVRILLQEQEAKPNNTQRRINQLVHAQQMREQVFNKSQLHQEIMKRIFDRHTKEEDFKVNYLVLKWDTRNEDKGRQKKFDNIWLGPFRIATYHRNNAYLLQEINGEITGGGAVNGMFLKHYLF